ncbi:DUF1566 domain-containing protein [Thiomicrospira sp. ALE5]|uniref:Lcl C-terminal domain-containing protein n=1 Tax=Thiomicrospira sp. ALE5 TaxID=748650 RepID=UPI0008EEDADA|nr:DUF1566 domain-containing protein [Thiomicrospira sp. ALE5]SFR54003.1 Protein of unknown function [Thiomicrospira sp. ALE5]
MKKQGFLKTTIFSMMLATGSLILIGCSADSSSADSSSASSVYNIGHGYIDNGDGTVTDTETNLTWMRCSLGQTWNGSTCLGDASRHNWQTARDLAKESHFADKSDWRLPTVDELHSLVYCGIFGEQRQRLLDASGETVWEGSSNLDGRCEGDYSRPTILNSAFPNTPGEWYWSASLIASPIGDDSDFVRGVNFYNGYDNFYVRSNSYHVRLVRGGQ